MDTDVAIDGLVIWDKGSLVVRQELTTQSTAASGLLAPRAHQHVVKSLAWNLCYPTCPTCSHRAHGIASELIAQCQTVRWRVLHRPRTHTQVFAPCSLQQRIGSLPRWVGAQHWRVLCGSRSAATPTACQRGLRCVAVRCGQTKSTWKFTIAPKLISRVTVGKLTPRMGKTEATYVYFLEITSPEWVTDFSTLAVQTAALPSTWARSF